MKFNNTWLSCATLWGVVVCLPSALHAQTSLLLRTGSEPGVLSVEQGQTFDIELQTADLALSGTGNVVGVQALIGFDDVALELLDITENGADNWTLVSEIVSGGDITYAAGIALGGSISTDGVVATLQFRALMPGTTNVTFRPDRGVSTRITYDDASFVLPTAVPSGDIDIPLCAVDGDCDDGDVCTADSCSGVNPGALSFDGSDDYVDLGNDATISDFGTGSFTIEGWCYLNSAPATWEGIFRHGRQGAFSQVAVQFASGQLTVSVESTAGGQVDTPGQAFSLNTWHHFAAVIDRSANQVHMYLDAGAPTTVASAWGANPISSADDVVLGMARDSSGTLFAPLDGLLDEIRIWDHARTPAEILANKDVEITSAPGLIARYGLNEAAGTTTTDSVGALVGNLTNGTAWETANVPDLGVGFCSFDAIAGCCIVDGDCADDGNACTDEECNANTCESIYSPTPGCCTVDADCDDGVVCTVDTCGGGGICDNTVDPLCCTTDGECDDSNPCTADTCDPGNVSALSFDGSNDHVTMGTALGLNAATFTLETWFQWHSGGSTASTGTGGISAYPLVTKGRGQSEDPTLNCAYFLGILPSGELTADFEEHGTGTTGGLNHPVTGTTALTPDDGQWHHAAVTYDGNCWQLYLDGVADTPGTNCPAEPPDFDSIQHFGLGTAFTSTGAAQGRLSGLLDEVRVWDHARSGAEILADMNAVIPSATGLLGRWGLDEGAGTTAADSTTPAEDGTIVGAAYVNSDLVNIGTPNTCINDDLPLGESCTDGDACNGEEVCDGAGTCQAGTNYDCDDGNPCTIDSCMSMNDAALSFDGSDDYVTMGPAPTLNTATFTVEAWVQWGGGGSTANTGGGGFLAYPMVTKGVGESETDGLNLNYFLGIVPASGNVLGGDFEQDAGGGSATGQNFPVLGTTPVSTGQWHHVAMTYDGTCWELYLDGVADTDGTTCPGEDPDFDTAQHFGLGTALSSTGAPSGAFDGLIDEVRVWDYARSASEIAEGLQRKIDTAPGLIGRWGLEEGALLVAADSTANGNDGTLTNGVAWQTVDLVGMVVCTNDATAANGLSCDDGAFCTTGETCTAGACGGGGPTDCSSASDQCNTGVCNEATDQCDPDPAPHEADPCDDGEFCTTGETCTAGACDGGTLTDCTILDDQCNTGVCNETTDQCEPDPVPHEDDPCDDGAFCTTGETCTAGVCDGGGLTDCSSETDQCNTGVCNEIADQCEPDPAPHEGNACDDGSLCSTVDVCGSGVCLGTTPLVCDDSNDCTDDSCVPATGCVFTDDDSNACTDNNACTADECLSGTCVSTPDFDCDDGDQCTIDTCDPSDGSCINDTVAAEGQGCDDGDLCTLSDTCQGGACVGVVNTCDDGDQCTVDTCNAGDGSCTNDAAAANGMTCSDGLLCTNPDTCNAGVCEGVAILCDDLNSCTDDACNPGTGTCDFVPNTGNSCTDNNACTEDVCDAAGDCISTVDVFCNDGEVCTIDSCDPGTGTCIFDGAAADGNACDDSDECTQTDACDGGACVGTNPVDCDDSNVCTVDSCDSGDGSCINDGAPVNGDPCDDGNPCTETDMCDGAGACVGSTIPGCIQCTVDGDCEDNDPCTVNTCNVDTCDFSVPAPDTTPCDDGNFCSVNDECTAGVCGGDARDCSAEDDQCNLGVCNEGLDQCEPQPANETDPCDDGLFCTTGETCNAGACDSGTLTDCTTFDDQCNVGVCNEGLGQCEAAPANEGLGCDDTLFCTVSDTCLSGACVGSARDCSAFDDQCNTGVCNEGLSTCEAQAANEGLGCDDGLFCNDGETCQAGACTGGGPTDCDDSDPCTADSCNETLNVCEASNLVEVDVTLELEGLGTAVVRDVTFVMTDCGVLTDTRTEPVAFDGAGLGAITLTDVDPAMLSISAVEGHTLRHVLPLSFVACVATADFTGADRLLAGDFHTASVPKDNFVDISDFAIVSANWLEFVDDCDGDLGTPDAQCTQGADATGDGLQSLPDFSAVLVNFFLVGDDEDLCPEPIAGNGPRSMISVNDLKLEKYLRADLNRDAIIDARDMAEFARRYKLRLTRSEAHKLQELEEDAEYEALELKGQSQKSR